MEGTHVRWRGVRLALSLALACTVAHGEAAAHPLFAGIGDQSAAMFSKPLYEKLGLRISRLVVPWNAALDPDRRDWVEHWLDAAQAAGAEPLVSFGRFSGQPMTPPPVAAYRQAFIAFRDAFPQVRDYTPWNEANHRAQPTFRRPGRAAAYYEVMRANCHGCKVVAADVLDTHGAGRWLREFLHALKGRRPRLWGIHNYVDANRHRPIAHGGTALISALLPGRIWLTETGGIVKSANMPYDEQRAARAIRYVFSIATKLRSRVSRVYIYNWRGVVTADEARIQPETWDSGITEPDGKPRPSYFALRYELRRLHLGCFSPRRSPPVAPWLQGCERALPPAPVGG